MESILIDAINVMVIRVKYLYSSWNDYMRVVIIENMAGTPRGQIGVALNEANAEIITFSPYLGQALPTDIDDYDALVVLGGEQSALDDEKFPYLAGLAALMRQFVESEKAVLGVCLGSQLLARAYHGENILQATKEFGWHDIDVLDAGKADPIFSNLGSSFKTFEWHADTFTLPSEAIHLASNIDTKNQAYRIGRAGYGMQFHFEANTSVVDDWTQNFQNSIERMSKGWLDNYADHRTQSSQMADEAGLIIAREWVKLI